MVTSEMKNKKNKTREQKKRQEIRKGNSVLHSLAICVVY